MKLDICLSIACCFLSTQASDQNYDSLNVPSNIARAMRRIDQQERSVNPFGFDKQQSRTVALLQDGQLKSALVLYLDMAYKWKDDEAVAILARENLKKIYE